MEGFENWLRERGISLKGSRDIVSRLRRLNKFFPVNVTVDFPYAVVEMEKKDEYRALSRYVKSQVKRSMKLYYEFKSGPSEKNPEH